MRFNPPGFLTDLDSSGAEAWSAWISAQLDRARSADGSDEGLTNFGPRLQFFNPSVSPPDTDAVERDIEWSAFPRIVQLQSSTEKQRWRAADSSRDLQDEYCEWSVARDPSSGKVVGVTFTSEGPEYWKYLARVQPDTVLALYQQHIGPQVKRSDLFPNGKYDPRNRWNSSTVNGAMHLIQRNNTLSAEIELAAAASIVRMADGRLVTDAQELIDCGAYGQRERHSDPFIGSVVNELAREKADVTLANPVGLYIAGLSVAGWRTPDASDPMDYWTITRGTKEKALRAVYEVPASKGFVVGDIRIGTRTIQFGAQIADFITIKLTGLATRIGRSTVPPVQGCVAQAAAFAALADADVSVESALAEPEPVTRR
jgi:hypothetical protein